MLELLQTVIARSMLPGISPPAAILKLLTFDGRAPLEQRLSSLAEFDRAIFDVLPSSKRATLGNQPSRQQDCESLQLFYNPLGRLHIRRAGNEAPDYGLGAAINIGILSLERTLVAEAEARADDLKREELAWRAKLEKTLGDIEREGALAQLLDDVEDSVR
ncbi:MAG TPA: hypothetical protein VJ734_00250, partial [Nitrosospira sp.]|nr:hypothetical protein [Nitrosospira sp.]